MNEIVKNAGQVQPQEVILVPADHCKIISKKIMGTNVKGAARVYEVVIESVAGPFAGTQATVIYSSDDEITVIQSLTFMDKFNIWWNNVILNVSKWCN